MMADKFYLIRSHIEIDNQLLQIFMTIVLSLFCSNLMGQNVVSNEAKVDYLQRIYFSGENKEGIVKNVLITIQELSEMSVTPGLEVQYVFLNEIQNQVSNAEDTCDALDLISVGIYEIDPSEAAKQGVVLPSEEAKLKSVDAMANLNKINKNAKSLSRTANRFEMTSLAGTTGTVGELAVAAGEVGQVIKDVGEIGKMIGFKKDKPCSKVPKKEIQIGNHTFIAEPTIGGNDREGDKFTTIILISNLSFASLRTLADTLENQTTINSVDKVFNETASTITVIHMGSTDELAEWLYDKFNHMINLIAFESGKINLTAKLD